MISILINKILLFYSKLHSKMSNIWFSPETATISGGGAEGNRDEITSSVVVKIHRCIIKLNISQISNKCQT